MGARNSSSPQSRGQESEAKPWPASSSSWDSRGHLAYGHITPASAQCEHVTPFPVCASVSKCPSPKDTCQAPRAPPVQCGFILIRFLLQ